MGILVAEGTGGGVGEWGRKRWGREISVEESEDGPLIG